MLASAPPEWPHSRAHLNAADRSHPRPCSLSPVPALCAGSTWVPLAKAKVPPAAPICMPRPRSLLQHPCACQGQGPSWHVPPCSPCCQLRIRARAYPKSYLDLEGHQDGRSPHPAWQVMHEDWRLTFYQASRPSLPRAYPTLPAHPLYCSRAFCPPYRAYVRGILELPLAPATGLTAAH